MPKCPTGLQMLKCSSALQVSLIFECPLEVFKCNLHVQIFDQMWLEQNANIKRCLTYMKQEKNGKKAFEELNFDTESKY